jgi:hypothetical protein
MENEQLGEVELAIVADITAKIKEACNKSKYTHVCQRVTTENGMAYVVNRCIKMMSNDKIKLSSALAYLESEMEGMN